MSELHDIAVIGTGTMGGNLVLNLLDKGMSVVAMDRNDEKLQALKQRSGDNPHLTTTRALRCLVEALSSPRKILLSLPAGDGVDELVSTLTAHLEPSDVVADLGNSHFQRTESRGLVLARSGIRFLGIGVSGGKKGAREGPSIMVGGHEVGYRPLKPILSAIAAHGDGPCVAYLGSGGAGHLVKTVHNAVEYAEIQLLAETYLIMRQHAQLTNEQTADVFEQWNDGQTASYLTHEASRVLRIQDEGRRAIVDLIEDVAAHKGTGRWAVQTALDFSSPTPSLSAAVDARLLSARKQERLTNQKRYNKSKERLGCESNVNQQDFLGQLKGALLASRILNYVQGLDLIRKVSDEMEYNTRLSEVIRVWKAGSIVQSAVLNPLHAATLDIPAGNLLVHPKILYLLSPLIPDLRRMVALTTSQAYPAPVLRAGLSYFDQITSEKLPANLIQALRDAFGDHGFKRVDTEGTHHLPDELSDEDPGQID